MGLEFELKLGLRLGQGNAVGFEVRVEVGVGFAIVAGVWLSASVDSGKSEEIPT